MRTEEEFIEIYNQNDFEVALFQWKIQDTIGSVKTYAFDEKTKIPANGYLVISRPQSRITLNNSNDGLNLIQPNDNIIDTITYAKAPIGQSYNRINSNWVWSSILTPGQPNKIPAKATKVGPSSSKLEEPDEVKLRPAGFFEKKGAAEASGQISNPLKLLKSLKPLNTILTALAIAIFSAIIILILKIKLNKYKPGSEI